MKKIFLIVPILLLINGCSNNPIEKEFLKIETPEYSCKIQLPTDREIDIWSKHPENNHSSSKQRCKEERSSCSDEFFEILEDFAYFQQKYSRIQSSGIMKHQRNIQKNFCLPNEYESKLKKIKKKGFFS
jgi:hypothetical protein